MEILIYALINLFVPLTLLALVLLCDLLSFIINLIILIVEIVCFFSGKSSPLESAAKPPPPTAVTKSANTAPAPRHRGNRWSRRLLWASGIILVVFLIMMTVANLFFFDDMVRMMAHYGTKGTGIQVNFDKVSGSLWKGKFEFTGLSVTRLSQSVNTFAIKIDSAEVDISMAALPWQRIVVESLVVKGVRGDYRKLGHASRYTPRRSFRIEDFNLSDLRVDYINRMAGSDALPVVVKIDAMRSTLMRSNWLVFDLLFLSNIDGSFDGTAFQVVTERVAYASYLTRWRADDMPVSLLKAIVGTPFGIFERGRVDISIENRLTLKPENALDMDWSLVIRDFKARVPPDSSLKAKAALSPIVFYLNRKRERLELAFGIAWDAKEGKSELSSSDDLDDMFDLGKRLADTLTRRMKKDESR